MSYRAFYFIVFLLVVIDINVSLANVDILYTSPENNAEYLRPQETIIISANKEIDPNSLTNSGIISVSGKLRSNYPGDIILSDDNKTIIYKPTSDFQYSDNITVTVSAGIKTDDGNSINPKQFSFTIRGSDAQLDNRQHLLSEFKSNSPLYDFHYSHFGDSLPANFPILSIINSSNPSEGKLFFSNFTHNDLVNNSSGNGEDDNPSTGTISPYLVILENTGEPYFYRRLDRYGIDFKKTRTGNLSYYDGKHLYFNIMDKNFNVIDHIKCGNGYPTDTHELLMLENGHALLMSYDDVQIDMSQIVPGGHPRAMVTGLVIQELDRSKNVVFQWRSWDHFKITDASHVDLTFARIDYAHGNSIDVDLDGNLLISSRHMDEITKINRVTGEIVWRLGGKNNEFTFTNDTLMFSHQHNARRISPGRITLFDNGNFHNPPYSRAVEYELDEVNKTATLVWQFDHNKEIFGYAMGNVQRLSNGNTLIGWGAAYPNITEVDASGNIVFEMGLDGDTLWSYRAFKFNFDNSENQNPSDYSLSQNYPNPFNPSTTLNFTIPSQTYVTLKIYDVIGREVANLVSQELSSGSYNILWNAENFSSGVYFYSISAGEFNETKKMILLK